MDWSIHVAKCKCQWIHLVVRQFDVQLWLNKKLKKFHFDYTIKRRIEIFQCKLTERYKPPTHEPRLNKYKWQYIVINSVEFINQIVVFIQKKVYLSFPILGIWIDRKLFKHIKSLGSRPIFADAIAFNGDQLKHNHSVFGIIIFCHIQIPSL